MSKKLYDKDGKEVKRGGCLKWAVIIIGVLIVFGVIRNMNGGGDKSEKAENAASSTVSSTEKSTKTDSKVESKPEKEEKKDNVPQEYKNALKKAESYSAMMHMSKISIYDQLTSEHGEHFGPEAAQYAVDNLKADYKANALEKAKSYYKDMAMSKDAVYEQLISEHGEQFTPEEAQYAVDNLPE